MLVCEVDNNSCTIVLFCDLNPWYSSKKTKVNTWVIYSPMISRFRTTGVLGRNTFETMILHSAIHVYRNS